MAPFERGDLKKLQNVELSLLKWVQSVCEAHSLTYFLIEGSLLGAVRHQGFIPWDDDIDLGMPRQDYERFLKTAPALLPDHIRIVTYENATGALRNFAQIESGDVKVVFSARETACVQNAWIDIFPLDWLPAGRLKRTWHLLRILVLRMRIQFSQFDQNVDIHRKNRPAYERFLIWLYRKTRLGSKTDTKKLVLKLEALLKKYEQTEKSYCINASSAYKTRAVFPWRYYGSGRAYTFEGTQVNGPLAYDEILRRLYGDYMTPPPVGERNRHYTKVLSDPEDFPS
ncbi:MAG: LicD family protein [Christensenellales bacterium]